MRTDGSLNAHECKALWLDPFQQIDAEQMSQLKQANISILPLRTLDELGLGLKTADMLVLRIKEDLGLYKEVARLMESLKSSVPIICRVARSQFELGILAMRQGAFYVVVDTDLDGPSWLRVADEVMAKKVQTTEEQTDEPKQDEAVRSQRPLENDPSVESTIQKNAPKRFIFVDRKSQSLLALAQRVGLTEVSTLITGPTGTGKDVLATVIHESSARAAGPFVPLNCGAIPENLIEDMLFGHERGAYTGAIREHKGVFEQAQGGTVFLDEIGELPLPLQAKLLRVIQDRKVTRLGATQPIELNFRLICATNKDLKQAMIERTFREDLYFRLSTFRLFIPPLRSRLGDIPPLVALFMARHAESGTAQSISTQAMQALLAHAWPGNVRELDNVIQRALILCPGLQIELEHLIFDDLDGDDASLAHSFDQSSSMLEGPARTHAEASTLMRRFSESLVAKQQSTALEDEQKTSDEKNEDFASPSFNNTTEYGLSSDDEDTTVSSSAVMVSTPNGLGLMELPPTISLSSFRKTNERQVILAALESAPTKAEAARRLGISPRTLRYKMAQLRMAGAA